jgi:protein-tyrosine-phosphatase
MGQRLFTALAAAAVWASAQSMPADYDAVLKQLGKQGDFKSNVLKINIPRNDLKVAIDGIATPTPFGFGGWVAMTKGDGGNEVLMGDLVLLEDEVNPVMSALLSNGLEVTALHNHFFFESPRIFYLHVHGHGKAADLAGNLKPALDLIGKTPAPHQTTVTGTKGGVSAAAIDTSKIAKLIGHEGEQSGQVYKITIGREDIALKEMGAPINARMGLNTWAAFFGSDSSAEIAGDVAMLANEVTPVLKALRSNGLNVVAIHNHMTAAEPAVYFLHYWGTGPVENLAAGFKAALNQLGKGSSHMAGATEPAPEVGSSTIVFVCEHGSAKSVVAAAHFNRLAAEQGLPYRAVSRGTHPDAAVAPNVRAGLAADGLDVSAWQPKAVTDQEIHSAAKVVSLATDLPAAKPFAKPKLTEWNDIPNISADYGQARTAIVELVESLVKSLPRQ